MYNQLIFSVSLECSFHPRLVKFGKRFPRKRERWVVTLPLRRHGPFHRCPYMDSHLPKSSLYLRRFRNKSREPRKCFFGPLDDPIPQGSFIHVRQFLRFFSVYITYHDGRIVDRNNIPQGALCYTFLNRRHPLAVFIGRIHATQRDFLNRRNIILDGYGNVANRILGQPFFPSSQRCGNVEIAGFCRLYFLRMTIHHLPRLCLGFSPTQHRASGVKHNLFLFL